MRSVLMVLWVLMCASLAVAALAQTTSSVTATYFTTSSDHLFRAWADRWIPLSHNRSGKLLTYQDRCGCVAIRISDRTAYLPCDEHAPAVRAALPKGCPE